MRPSVSEGRVLERVNPEPQAKGAKPDAKSHVAWKSEVGKSGKVEGSA